jgi:predicted Zn-dependent peptidase
MIMKHLKTVKTIFMLLTLLASQAINAQSNYKTETRTSGRFMYDIVVNDPTETRIYTLANGLKVYLSKSTEMPRMQTCIAVRTGSKNDPAECTGLAHYLEHMLFKGTDKYGSKDFAKEKPLLDAIENTYEIYRKTTDEAKRKAIYKTIDSLSGEAAKYAIANEYDKMCTEMGAKGTNAYTSLDVTCYINDVPSNQFEKWCMMEAERFRNPQMRLFHTELEAVYEEKNIGMDNDTRGVYEKIFSELFKKHGYGTKTTIGTVEHLKNPSIKEILKYYNKYYVPNNVALCIAGDMDYDKTIEVIANNFSAWKPGNPEQMTFPAEDAITAPILKTIVGPEEERVMLAYRTPGAQLKKEVTVLNLINKMLYNGVAGLVDLDLVQKQKVREGFAYIDQNADHGIFVFGAKPMPGSKLEEVKDMLLAEVDKIKKGEFSDELLQAIINNLAKEDYQKFESYQSRAYFFVDAFINQLDWIDVVKQSEDLKNVTKAQVVAAANRYFAENYVCVMKKTGEREEKSKIVKPTITPVAVNRDEKSPFLQNVTTKKTDEIKPVFLDLEKDLQKSMLKNGSKVLSVKNTVNPLFNLEYAWKLGKLNAPETAFAAEYLQYLGTKLMKAEDLQLKMYGLACSYFVDVSDNELRIGVEGVNQNMEAALKLLEDVMTNAVADKDALDNMVAGEVQKRSDEKKNKNVIRQMLINYGLYGPSNKYTTRINEAQMKALTPEKLLAKVKELKSLQHDVYYFGPSDNAEVAKIVEKVHKTEKKLEVAPPIKIFTVKTEAEPTVFFVDYDMVQADLVWTAKGLDFNKDMLPEVRLYNEYFGGGMSGVVFQTIRESKALAYSTNSTYRSPYTKEEPFTLFSYVGTQADKISEAAPAMLELLNDMPNSPNLFDLAKKSIKNQIETERITKQNIIYRADMMERLGVKEDTRKAVYEKTQKMTYDDLKKFADTNIKNKQSNFLVLGSSKKVDFKVLEKYGKVVKLSMSDVFGETVKP